MQDLVRGVQTRRADDPCPEWRSSRTGRFATSSAPGVAFLVAYLLQGQNDRFRWLPSHKVLDRGRLPIGHLRFPDLRDDDHPRLVVGISIAWFALLGLGIRRRPRHW